MLPTRQRHWPCRGFTVVAQERRLYAFVEEINPQFAVISRRDAMSVRNRKNPPPPPKSANLAGNYGTIGISAVKLRRDTAGASKDRAGRREG
jgi:hypothetical protein